MEPNFRICPDCSTKNRLDKEFCVKCGEPLEGFVVGGPGATTEISRARDVGKKGKARFFVADHENKSPLIAALVALIGFGGLFGAWRILRKGVPAATSEQPVRSILAPVQARPASAPISPAPGLSDYSAGVAALRAVDYPLAVKLLQAATRAAPAKADYRLSLAEALEKSGSLGAALSAYETAAGLDSANVRYTSEWAKALDRAGRYPDAIRVYEVALRMDPENLANLREVANLQMKANDFAIARPHLEKIAALRPDDLLPKQDLARALEATNELAGAANQYRSILTLMPAAHLSRANLSEVLMKQNRPDEALKVLDEGLATSPSAALLYREKGRVLDRLGRDHEAVVAYREYLRLAPGTSDARAFTERIAQLQPSGAP